MTIRELLLKIIIAIEGAIDEVLFFIEDVARKIQAGQFLELTINQVKIISLLLLTWVLLGMWCGDIVEELGEKFEKKMPSIFGGNISHLDWIKWATIFFSTILFSLWSYSLYGRPWEQVSTRLLIAIPIFVGCMWGGYFLYRWFFLKFITKYIKSPHEEENKKE